MHKNTPARNKVYNDDLFADWELELLLRHRLRTASPQDLPASINSPQELAVLWRALYFSERKNIFWAILFENLHLSPVLNWLTIDSQRLDEFLAYLPVYFTEKRPEHKQLQHLVNLFGQEFYDRFRAIAALLDGEACSYLVSRSANPQFRQLLKQRLHFLGQKRSAFFYGLDEPLKSVVCPSLFGDKIKLLESGLQLLQLDLEENPVVNNRPALKLEAAQAFFHAGLVADSLALLIAAVKAQAPDPAESLISCQNKQFARLLRQVTASYCLIYTPDTAGFHYSRIYHDHFPFQEPDKATLKYLAIFDLIKLGRQSENFYPLYQIAYETELISELRNNEYLLLSKVDLEQGLSTSRMQQLQALIEQKLLSLPHEAFITIQLLSLLLEKGLAAPGLLPDFLLSKSLLLFDWVPSPLFLNHRFLNSLSLLLKNELREEAERILAAIAACNNCGSSAELVQKLELSKVKDNAWLRQITAGKFLGVL